MQLLVKILQFSDQIEMIFSSSFWQVSINLLSFAAQILSQTGRQTDRQWADRRGEKGYGRGPVQLVGEAIKPTFY